MSGAHDHLDHVPQRIAPLPSPRADDQPAGPSLARAGDPRLAHPAAAGPELLRLQRFAGNAAVSALVASPVQRAVTLSEVEPEASAPGGSPAGGSPETAAPAPGPTGPTGTGADASPVTSDGGTTTITGGVVNLDTPMVRAQGVIRADTIVVDNVVASSYTPGAGNIW